MALVPSKHWEDKSVDQVEASGDDYQRRNASIGGGMGEGLRGWGGSHFACLHFYVNWDAPPSPL